MFRDVGIANWHCGVAAAIANAVYQAAGKCVGDSPITLDRLDGP
jgi:CO/xanthine dehydrogenase Mo-binding subunit